MRGRPLEEGSRISTIYRPSSSSTPAEEAGGEPAGAGVTRLAKGEIGVSEVVVVLMVVAVGAAGAGTAAGATGVRGAPAGRACPHILHW